MVIGIGYIGSDDDAIMQKEVFTYTSMYKGKLYVFRNLIEGDIGDVPYEVVGKLVEELDFSHQGNEQDVVELGKEFDSEHLFVRIQPISKELEQEILNHF